MRLVVSSTYLTDPLTGTATLATNILYVSASSNVSDIASSSGLDPIIVYPFNCGAVFILTDGLYVIVSSGLPWILSLSNKGSPLKSMSAVISGSFVIS